MTSDLDLFTPDATARIDPALVTIGTVYAKKPAERLVVVQVREELVELPAQPGRYRLASTVADAPNALARVLLNPQTARPVLVLGPVNPHQPAVLGTVLATGPGTVTVSIEGAEHELQAAPSTYTTGGTAWVLTDDWGRPALVLAPSGLTPATPGVPPPPPPTPGGVQAVASIGPQWSGSWRASRGAWDRWNTNRYGGRSTLYQGTNGESGPMVGLAVYGDQLANLGATSIDRVQVAIRSVGLASGSPAVTIQGSPHGTPPGGAPVASGGTASGMDALVDLPADVRDGMRTGAVKGLALVGGPYSAAAGAGNGDGMVLTVTYTRPA